jgi:hypothetical protein
MLGPVQSVASVGSSAQSGITRAISRFSSAASEVAESTAGSGGAGDDTASFSTAARAQFAQAQGGVGSLEHGLIEEGQAKQDLAANVRVLQTADEMFGTLVSIGSKR